MVPGFGPMEMIVILVIALVVIGPKKLPDMARSAGKGMREFKSAVSGDGDGDDDKAADRLTAATSVQGDRPPA